jgi:aspartokinase/homoserine dehydrogenase 1
MYTANPKIVKQAQPIASISYQEAMELSHFELKYCSLHYSARPEKKHSYSYQEYFRTRREGTYISNTSISNGQ